MVIHNSIINLKAFINLQFMTRWGVSPTMKLALVWYLVIFVFQGDLDALTRPSLFCPSSKAWRDNKRNIFAWRKLLDLIEFNKILPCYFYIYTAAHEIKRFKEALSIRSFLLIHAHFMLLSFILRWIYQPIYTKPQYTCISHNNKLKFI
jgi:hypothetical protein